jgi:HEAT repeat protein
VFEGKPVTTLFEILKTGSELERCRAVIALEHVHHGCEQHCMHSVMRMPDEQMRRRMLRCAEAGHMGTRARIILPHLMAALRDPSAEVRWHAASVLGEEMCGEALPACPALRESMGDPDPRVRLWAARALYWIRFEIEGPIRTSIHAFQEDPNPRVRSMALENFHWMGSDARSAIPVLEKALQDPDADVRQYAQRVLDDVRR